MDLIHPDPPNPGKKISQCQALDNQSTKNIVQNINQYVQTKNIMDIDIWAACKLTNGNIVSNTANDSKTKKLLENDYWKEVLGRGAKSVTRTFGGVAYVVYIDSIDLANKDVMMKKIHAKNDASILGFEIKWIRWLSSLAPGKKKSLLVVEYKIAMQANRAIDKGLVIGAELHRYIMYNAACK